ncbi:unnamed protein product [Closterium sp. NIES-53]
MASYGWQKEYFSSNRKAKRVGFFVNRSDSQHSPPSPASPGGSPSAPARAAGGASLRGTLRGVKQAARAAGGAVAGRGGQGRGGQGRGGHKAQRLPALGVRRRGALKGGVGLGHGGRGSGVGLMMIGMRGRGRGGGRGRGRGQGRGTACAAAVVAAGRCAAGAAGCGKEAGGGAGVLRGGKRGSYRGEDVRHAAKDGAAVADHAWHMIDGAVLYATWQPGVVLWSAKVALSELQSAIHGGAEGSSLASAMGLVDRWYSALCTDGMGEMGSGGSWKG